MGRKCYVLDCLSEEGRHEDRGVTFHKIPLHPDIRPKWLELCRVPEDKHNCKVIHVCSRHFLNIDFCRYKGKKYMLKQGALPSVFSWSKLRKAVTFGIIGKKESIKMDSEPTNDSTTPDIIAKIKEEPCEPKENVELKEEVIHTPNDLSMKIKKEPEMSSTTIEQKGKSIQTPLGLLNFTVNTQLEALDFNQMWFPAHIVEVDYEENEVFIHFENYSSKYDEWISMNSSRLRPLQPVSKKSAPTEIFVEGEKVMASWSDSRKFPATVTKVLDNDTYEVLFTDGFVKVLKGHRIAKTHGKVLGSTPLFDPVSGTKQDRRDKKRKINVAELFRKRFKSDLDDSPASSTSDFHCNIEDCEGCVKWENGKPVGIESAIETTDGVRKSTIVSDPRLPPNWAKHLAQRVTGVSAGKWDIVIVSPEGKKFRTRSDLKLYLEENPQLNYTEAMFDFSLHRRTRTRRLTQTTDASQQLEVIPPEEHVDIDNPNSLKILLVGDAYKCPIEGCEKSFRRKNLAQMHVKHYHPKYTKYLESTPNVADLAYARTVGESLDKSPDRTTKLLPARPLQKIILPKTSIPTPPIESEFKQQPDMQPITLEKTKDSEILKLLNNNKVDEETQKFSTDSAPNTYPVLKLKDLLNNSEGVPKREDLNLKTLSASTVRPTGIKTLLPVIRTNELKKDRLEDNKIMDQDQWPKGQEVHSLPESNPNYIVEGGEVIKIVRMRSEEIINCTCGITEEDGLMIQCELCLCWQHAYCNNIERENQVPDKYICYICQNPRRQRSSSKYFHDQDWLKNGTLPVGNYHCKDVEALKNRFELLKGTHNLSGLVVELKDFVHSLKVKLKIAETKNHQKLYLWSKPWEKHCLPELKLKEEQGEKHKLAENQVGQSDSSLYSILKSTKIKDESNFHTLMDNNLEQLPTSVPIIPQPEAAIDSTDCKFNLLDHIAHAQDLIHERLNAVETQMDALDGGGPTTENEGSHIRETVEMLLKDLRTLQEFSYSNSL
ncbi:hypothetical protein FQA39_LY15555 [Lamprigera yunnana]|nr:hypothetical protein FQA39_LY15555 [Lamprigera yunnana]